MKIESYESRSLPVLQQQSWYKEKVRKHDLNVVRTKEYIQVIPRKDVVDTDIGWN